MFSPRSDLSLIVLPDDSADTRNALQYKISKGQTRPDAILCSDFSQDPFYCHEILITTAEPDKRLEKGFIYLTPPDFKALPETCMRLQQKNCLFCLCDSVPDNDCGIHFINRKLFHSGKKVYLLIQLQNDPLQVTVSLRQL